MNPVARGLGVEKASCLRVVSVTSGLEVHCVRTGCGAFQQCDEALNSVANIGLMHYEKTMSYTRNLTLELKDVFFGRLRS